MFRRQAARPGGGAATYSTRPRRYFYQLSKKVRQVGQRFVSKGVSLPYLVPTCPTRAGLRRGENPINRSLAHTEPLRDFCAGAAFCGQCTDLIGLGSRGRLASAVFALSLRFGDTLALARQHDLPLELGDRAEHIQ